MLRKVRSIPTRFAALLAAACTAGFVVVVFAMPARAGSIRATLDTDAKITQVHAVGRQAKEIVTSKGETKDIGMYGKPFPGRVEGDAIVIEDLPVPGLYDLRFVTESGAVIEGWDATVPESDYVEQLPLPAADRDKLFEKLAGRDFSEFADDVRVLDAKGNTQNAAILVMHLRVRAFAGGNYQPGEWVWRVNRTQWENPDEHTWVPYRPRPFYALIRQRLFEKPFHNKSHVFARHLGGITLSEEQREVDLGRIVVPEPDGGVYAVQPDGSRIVPTVLKGPVVPVPGKEQANP